MSKKKERKCKAVDSLKPHFHTCPVYNTVYSVCMQFGLKGRMVKNFDCYDYDLIGKYCCEDCPFAPPEFEEV